jgi:hypothetical protein
LKSTRFAMMFVALVFVSALLAGAFAQSANALGAEIYRTDSQGNKNGGFVNIGQTAGTALCTRTGVGAIRYGVAVCYYPIP